MNAKVEVKASFSPGENQSVTKISNVKAQKNDHDEVIQILHTYLFEANHDYFLLQIIKKSLETVM